MVGFEFRFGWVRLRDWLGQTSSLVGLGLGLVRFNWVKVRVRFRARDILV